SCCAGAAHAPSAPARAVARGSWRAPASSKTTRSSSFGWRPSGFLVSGPTGRMGTTPASTDSACYGRFAPARNARLCGPRIELLGELAVEAETGLEGCLRPVADDLLGELARPEHSDVRNAPNPVTLGQRWLLVDVPLGDLDFAVPRGHPFQQP